MHAAKIIIMLVSSTLCCWATSYSEAYLGTFFVFLDPEPSEIQLNVMSFVPTWICNNHSVLHDLMEIRRQSKSMLSSNMQAYA